MDSQSLKNILKFSSFVGIAVSIFFLLPIMIGLYYNEDMRYFFFVDILIFLSNLTILLLYKQHKINLSIKEGILSVNLIWILLGLTTAIPFDIYTNASYIDGLFEAISGFTTTGATIYTEIESLPKSILFLRSLTHWLGGMGIIVLGVGLFSLINPSGSLTLFKAESTGIKIEKITPKIKDTALRLWGLYLLFTLLDFIALKLAGMHYFDAINHAFSTISTGGFSTKDSSLGAFSSPLIYWITTFFMIISGINFLAHLRFFSTGKLDSYKKSEVLWYLWIFFLLSLLLSLIVIIIEGDHFFHASTHAFFTIASVLTTTGFATLDYEHWGNIAIAIIFLAMLIGGNTGSTAGGVKTIRYIVMFKNMKNQLIQTLNPKVLTGVFIDKQRINSQTINATIGFLFLFILTNSLLSFYLFARGYDTLTSISTAIACVGNVGPGFALTGPTQNYSFFAAPDKIILSIGMIAGRLELYTMVLLFTRTFWKKF